MYRLKYLDVCQCGAKLKKGKNVRACELATISHYVTRRHPSVIQLLQPLDAAAVSNKSSPGNLSTSRRPAAVSTSYTSRQQEMNE